MRITYKVGRGRRWLIPVLVLFSLAALSGVGTKLYTSFAMGDDAPARSLGPIAPVSGSGFTIQPLRILLRPDAPSVVIAAVFVSPEFESVAGEYADWRFAPEHVTLRAKVRGEAKELAVLSVSALEAEGGMSVVALLFAPLQREEQASEITLALESMRASSRNTGMVTTFDGEWKLSVSREHFSRGPSGELTASYGSPLTQRGVTLTPLACPYQSSGSRVAAYLMEGPHPRTFDVIVGEDGKIVIERGACS